MSFDAEIQGLEALQIASARAIAALKPDGALGRAIVYITTRAYQTAVANTVVATGTWRASQRMQVNGLSGRVFLDPTATNPKSPKARPSVYGAFLEETRGGRYAVYDQTTNNAGPDIVAEAGRILMGDLST